MFARRCSAFVFLRAEVLQGRRKESDCRSSLELWAALEKPRVDIVLKRADRHAVALLEH
ncbi:MAG: hypothetical protein R3A47_05055 [Polyangiales bacterium]